MTKKPERTSQKDEQGHGRTVSLKRFVCHRANGMSYEKKIHNKETNKQMHGRIRTPG